MNFGDALKALKKGKCVQRTGWNGKGLFIYLVPAASYPAQTGAAKAHFGEGAMVPYAAYIALKNIDETVSTWAPSINDTLAEDWQVIGCTVPPHQQRVLDEKAELDERLAKLDAFILDNPTFLTLPDDERYHLQQQSELMSKLSAILDARIANF